MKRRIMSFAVTLAMSAMLFGCGSQQSTPAPAASSAEATTAEAPAAEASTESAAADSGTEASETGTADVSGFKIAWVDGNFANESNMVMLDLSTEYAMSEYGITLQSYDGQGSGENQVSQIETLIEQGVDCIIVQPYDAAACQVGVQAAIDAGVPVLVTKTTIEDNSVCPFVGQDDVIAGEIEMQYIVDELGGEGNIVIIEGPTGISAAINRNDGIQNVLSSNPGINVLHSEPANWNRDEGMNLMETWLQLGEDIHAVVAHNDEMALGAYDAISDAGKAGEIKVIGIDAIDAALASVAAGEMDATVLQDVETIGKRTIDVAVMMCQGQQVDPVYNIDPVLLTIDNVGDYQ